MRGPQVGRAVNEQLAYRLPQLNFQNFAISSLPSPQRLILSFADRVRLSPSFRPLRSLLRFRLCRRVIRVFGTYNKQKNVPDNLSQNGHVSGMIINPQNSTTSDNISTQNRVFGTINTPNTLYPRGMEVADTSQNTIQHEGLAYLEMRSARLHGAENRVPLQLESADLQQERLELMDLEKVMLKVLARQKEILENKDTLIAKLKAELASKDEEIKLQKMKWGKAQDNTFKATENKGNLFSDSELSSSPKVAADGPPAKRRRLAVADARNPRPILGVHNTDLIAEDSRNNPSSIRSTFPIHRRKTQSDKSTQTADRSEFTIKLWGNLKIFRKTPADIGSDSGSDSEVDKFFGTQSGPDSMPKGLGYIPGERGTKVQETPRGCHLGGSSQQHHLSNVS